MSKNTIESQSAKILKHLEKGRTLTQLQASNWWGCYRLAARIHRLRQRGHNIEAVKLRAGSKSWARYSLSV